MSNDNTAHPLQKSKSMGHYIFGKTLGEGTFGKVKLATHILTGEKVAIKILEKQKIIDQSDVERVTREIQILKMLRHPNLVQLYEIIETPKQLFLVMEYVSGGELFDYIVQNTRIRDLEAARIFSQIISGIEYVHKLKVVHRDMKPENLLLESKGRVKLVDFGLSNTYKQGELLKTACGSPCYAAPEMIAGQKYNGLQVDLWSCGVILFAMLSGYLPFEDANTAVLYKKIQSGDFKIPKTVTPEAKDLIQHILTVDPLKRFGIPEIRRHPWFNICRQSKIPQGLIVGINQMPIDEDIMKLLIQFSITDEIARKCIENNRHNHVTTTYYLLLKKHLQAGGKSNAGDISNENFEPQLIQQKQLKLFNPVNPLPSLQIHRRGRCAEDQSPLNVRQASRQYQYSISTQHSSIPQSPKPQNYSTEVTKRLNCQQDSKNQTIYRLNLDQDQKVLKLRTPVSRTRVVSDHQSKLPRRIILNGEIRGRSTDNSQDNELQSRTFYRASPNFQK